MAYNPSHNFNGTAVNEIMSLGIKDEAIINAISSTNRADFVPSSIKQYANNDYYLFYSEDRFLHARHTLATILANITYSKEQTVAAFGVGSGYLAVVLAKIFKHVYALESSNTYSSELKKNTHHFKNISCATELSGLNSLCDFIFVENFLGYSKKELTNKLNKNGILVYIEQEVGVNFIFMESKNGEKKKIQELVAFPEISGNLSEDFVF